MNIQVSLNGKRVALIGTMHTIAIAALDAMLSNGAQRREVDSIEPPDILLIAFAMLPQEVSGADSAAESTRSVTTQSLIDTGRVEAAQMATTDSGGRIVFLLSAAAGLPMRRHPEHSMQMALALAGLRGIAMQYGPKVLANAVGVGAIGEPIEAGDSAMLSHVALERAGTIEEVVDAVLFFCDPDNSYCTGQMLCVDGGWSAGYGRNF